MTGQLDLPAFYLFAIVFFWTPYHFWALALLIKRDYAEANIPMLPVVRGIPETTWNIFLYGLLLTALSLLFLPPRRWTGSTSSVLWCCVFLWCCWPGSCGDRIPFPTLEPPICTR